MQKNSENFSMQDMMHLVQSPAGQQLIALLQNANPAALQKATAKASSGDYSQAKEALAPLLESEDIRKLLRQIGGQTHG